ncbi:DEAD/DEAH box helicase [Paenibacillus guangzhouensis]|uniref:DEAD/DEAH box helicase n=1 Tax=Paenibacillus guangzhouensis TaxID=1473112 RepID=UPI0012673275|nr:DEAD/DEAH box helicase [Paenibacillus guangzhouensis]
MQVPLTLKRIRSLCGEKAYERGEAYRLAGQVQFVNKYPLTPYYAATVQDNSAYQVTVEIEPSGDIDAECSCLAFYSYDHYCKHVAAVLIHIHDILHGLDTPSGTRTPHESKTVSRDEQFMQSMLGLFRDKPVRSSATGTFLDARTLLQVEFHCRLIPYGARKFMFGIEIKVGPQRLYVVQRIRDFLEHIERGAPYTFAKHFTYEPTNYRFSKEDDAVLQELIRVHHQDKLYQERSTATSAQAARPASDSRTLLIPPFAWDKTLSFLQFASSVKLEHEGRIHEGITVSDEPIPLRFSFDEGSGDGCELDIQGFDEVTVLEAYNTLLYDSKLLKLKPAEARRIADIRQLIDTARKDQLHIPRAQMESFMEEVVPGLRKLGTVHIAQSISDRIVNTPLMAKLYLDRVNDKLLAGLEFHYGEMIFNPLEDSGQQHGSDRILIRDGEKEQRILALMDQSAFTKTDAGYYMENEDYEYEFLYRVVPELEKLAHIYATSAVKVRLHLPTVPPRITVNADERTDWLEFQFELDGISDAEIRKVVQALEDKRKYYKMPNGAFLPLEGEAFQEIIYLINEFGIRKSEITGTQLRVPIVRGLHLLDTAQPSPYVKLGKSFRKLIEHMRNPDHLDFPVPDSLAAILRDYQVYGFQWMKTLAHYRFGGILADDMGLGKTIQSITFLVSVLPEIRWEKRQALIICPASLVYNWQNELRRFAPEIRAVIADGSKTERSGIIRADDSEADVIITSYPLLRRDVSLYTKRSYHTLILDEAQAFKNYTTQTAQAVRELDARYRFALTGTPIENSLEELWSIFGVVFPDLLPGLKAFGDLSRDTIAKRIRPFLLRRLKSDVLKELPAKIESTQASELLPEQKKLYASFLAELQQETLKHLAEKDFYKTRIQILAGLTRLRQICCHPALFMEGYEGSSAKFEQLFEMIEECRGTGRRLLIFSQFTEMLGMIGRKLSRQGVPYFYLDGQTPSAERVEICHRFNEGERDLFLASLKAGGTGLNLTGADTVILYDLWWNPAVEQQAADRAHRIGQRRVVQVIRLVAQGTVEDKMYELQQRKMNLIDEVIQPGHEGLSALTEQEIREILMI